MDWFHRDTSALLPGPAPRGRYWPGGSAIFVFDPAAADGLGIEVAVVDLLPHQM